MGEKVNGIEKDLLKLFMKLLMTFEVLTEEDIVGISSIMKSEDAIFEMTDWLREHKDATETEIIKKAFEINKIDLF